jgi:hypothetical protein
MLPTIKPIYFDIGEADALRGKNSVLGCRELRQAGEKPAFFSFFLLLKRRMRNNKVVVWA